MKAARCLVHENNALMTTVAYWTQNASCVLTAPPRDCGISILRLSMLDQKLWNQSSSEITLIIKTGIFMQVEFDQRR